MIINFRNLMCSGGGGKPAVIEALSVTENGSYTPAEGTDGYAPVEVNVQPALQEKTATTNGEVIADTEFYGLSKVNVQVPIPTFTTEELTATENKVYTPTTDGYSKVTVNVPIKTVEEKKTVSILKNGTTEIVPGTGYDGIAGATINVNVPGAGEEKYKVLNGTVFTKIPSTFNIADYDWSIFDNFVQPFYSGGEIPYRSFIEQFKKYGTKLKVIELYTSDGTGEDIDFSGVDLSECYYIRIASRIVNNVNFSGCDLRKVQHLEIFITGNINLEGCTLNRPVVMEIAAQNAIEQFNKVNKNCSSLLEFPYLYSTDTDTTVLDISNQDFQSCKYFNFDLSIKRIKADNTKIKPIKIHGMEYTDMETVDLSFLDLSICGDIGSFLRNNTFVKTITGIGALRSPSGIECFYNDSELTTIDLSKWNLLDTYYTVSSFLNGCPKLTNVSFPYNMEYELDLSASVLLSKDSLLSLINGLYDFNGEAGHICTIGAENMAKLTPEEIAVATAKGWELK